MRRKAVPLRAEHTGHDWRFLDAHLDRDGNLHLDGQDLGPSTAAVSNDGEYEWFTTIRAEHLPRLREVLQIASDENLLVALAQRYSGIASYELERRIRESDVPVELTVWSG